MSDETITTGETEGVFLRTVMKKDVYERLTQYAKTYSTGRGHWDFGVAVQLLLDHYDGSQQALQSDKLDLILTLLSSKQEEPPKVEGTVMLGGSIVPR